VCRTDAWAPVVAFNCIWTRIVYSLLAETVFAPFVAFIGFAACSAAAEPEVFVDFAHGVLGGGGEGEKKGSCECGIKYGRASEDWSAVNADDVHFATCVRARMKYVTCAVREALSTLEI
jgi:hypothetical protein